MSNDIIISAINKWKDQPSSLIMILHEIQNNLSYIPRDAAMQISNELDLPLARIYEVLTFYSYFKIEPTGKIVISVCIGTACHLKGSADLLKEFENILGVKNNQTTEDGLFYLQTVRCLGCCGTSPVIRIDDQIYSNLHPSDIKPMIDKIRNSTS